MGFVIGTLCLLGLVALAAGGGRRRWRRHHHHHGHWRGGRRCGGRRGRWRGPEEDDLEDLADAQPWRGRRPEDFVEVALAGLGLREEQRPHVESAVRDAGKAVRNLVDHLKDSRDDLLGAIRGEVVDDAKLAAVFEWHDDALAQARKDVVDAVKRAHAALDPDQRAKLADALGRRPTWL